MEVSEQFTELPMTDHAVTLQILDFDCKRDAAAIPELIKGESESRGRLSLRLEQLPGSFRRQSTG